MAAETGLDKNAAQVEAVARYGRWVCGELLADKAPPGPAEICAALAGKNLACWCQAGTACHVDTLLELANK
ncbi:MAG: DUF4326 domain-containing protein [Candidatus Devosia euplotis]|nr:DUF4326 domain-containing protein [Candidatus Devosia euplotis]